MLKKLLWTVVLCSLFLPASGTKIVSTVKAEESCWKVIATELNIRSGPSTSYSEIGDYYYGDTVEGVSNGAGWVQTSAGWISQDWLNPCVSNSSISQSGNIVESMDGFTVVNRPVWMDAGKLTNMFRLVSQFTNNPQGVNCPDSPVVIYFGTANQATALAGKSVWGITGYYIWNGTQLVYERGHSCSELVRGVFILKGMSYINTWDTLGHEISHAFGAIHGASAPTNLPERNAEWTTYADAYWMGNEIRKAYYGNCGSPASEFCFAVNQQVFQ